jgi:hypothetical protein
MNTALKWLIPLIFVLALIATLAGIWPAEGTPYPLTTFRGEEVTINARGLYYWDTVSSAAQMQANDFVTLVLGLPLLAVSFWLARLGSLRGRLMLAGALGFILYTYITMCFGAHYNPLFLLYVALFSLSLFAFVLALLDIDLRTLPTHFTEKLPRRWIAGTLFIAAAFIALAWIGRIATTFTSGAIPTLENTTSMFIQVMDLGIIVPACVLSGILLLRRSAWGYLLTAVGLVKFMTLGISVSLMGLNMARVGTPDSAALVGAFGMLALLAIAMTLVLFRNIMEAAHK